MKTYNRFIQAMCNGITKLIICSSEGKEDVLTELLSQFCCGEFTRSSFFFFWHILSGPRPSSSSFPSNLLLELTILTPRSFTGPDNLEETEVFRYIYYDIHRCLLPMKAPQ